MPLTPVNILAGVCSLSCHGELRIFAVSPAPTFALMAIGLTHHSTGRCAIKPRTAGEFKRSPARSASDGGE